MSDGAERAVACVVECRLGCLLLIDLPLCRFVEDADVQQLFIHASAKDVLEHALAVLDVRVGIKVVNLPLHFLWIERLAVISLVEPSPFQASHLAFRIQKDGVYPVDDAVEVGLHLADVSHATVLAHVVLDVSLAHPVESTSKIVLPVDGSADEVAPLLHVGIL